MCSSTNMGKRKNRMVNAISNSILTSTHIGTVKSRITKEGGVVEVTRSQ